MIHTIGDSHSNWSNLSVQHHFGPLTCYNFGLDPSRIIVPDNILTSDTLVFCLGEIDCRCHIHVHGGKDTIDGIVERYVKAIRHITPKHVRIGVYNVVPPVRETTQYFNNVEFPFRGSDEERLDYTRIFNQKLKNYCELYNFWFVDIYSIYSDSEGFMRHDLSDGSVHIKYFNGLQKYLQLEESNVQ